MKSINVAPTFYNVTVACPGRERIARRPESRSAFLSVPQSRRRTRDFGVSRSRVESVGRRRVARWIRHALDCAYKARFDPESSRLFRWNPRRRLYKLNSRLSLRSGSIVYLERLIDPEIKRRKIRLTFITVSPEHAAAATRFPVHLIQIDPEIRSMFCICSCYNSFNFNCYYVNHNGRAKSQCR